MTHTKTASGADGLGAFAGAGGGGPFLIQESPEVDAMVNAAVAFLDAATAAAELQFRGVTMPDQTPEVALASGNIVHRTVLSMAFQMLLNQAITRNINAFNIMDGFGHGVGSVLATVPPHLARHVMADLFNAVQGYEQRTREAIEGTPTAGSA